MIQYLPDWLLESFQSINLFDRYVTWRDYFDAGLMVAMSLMIAEVIIVLLLTIPLEDKRSKLFGHIKGMLVATVILLIFAFVGISATYNYKLFMSDMDIASNYEELGDYIAAHDHYYDMLYKYNDTQKQNKVRLMLDKIDINYRLQMGILYEESGLYDQALSLFIEIISEDGVVDHIKNCTDAINKYEGGY